MRRRRRPDATAKASESPGAIRGFLLAGCTICDDFDTACIVAATRHCELQFLSSAHYI
jgi:hypothetical protein